MNKINQLAKNSFFMIFSQIFIRILSAVYTIILARHYGNSIYGSFAFAISLIGIFSLVSDLGISTLVTRDVAADTGKGRQYIINSLAVKSVLSIVTFLGIILYMDMFRVTGVSREITILMAITIITGTIASVMVSIISAYKQMEYIAITALLERIIAISLSLWFVSRNFSILFVAYANIISSLANSIILLLVTTRKFEKLNAKIDIKLIKDMVRIAFPMGISAMIITIYYRVDMIMIRQMKSEVDVGLYAASYTFINALSFIPSTLMSVVFPYMASSYKRSKEELFFIVEKILWIFSIIAIPISFGTISIARDVILKVYGQQYYGSIIALQILIWTVSIMFFNSLIGNVLVVLNRQKYVTFIVTCTAIFNIICNLFLIPAISYVGASFATVASELLVFIMAFIYLKKNKIVIPVFRYIKGPTLASLIMCFILFSLANLNIFIKILLGAVIYVTLLIVLRILKKQDIIMIKKVFIQKRRGI